MPDIPKITVLMPVYNCAKHVGEAIDSILNQTFVDFEFLIIDDASTDNTVSIIKKYSDSRIKLIEKPKNTGLTNSLNYGLSIAKGEYIARMDGDDISFPERFEKQIAFLETHSEIIVCGTNYKIIDTENIKKVPETHEEIKVTLLFSCCVGHPTVMIRKSTLMKHEIAYDTKMEPAEDYDLWVRLLQFGKLHNLQEVLLQYRVHQNQVSQNRSVSQQICSVKSRLLLLSYLKVNFDVKEEELLKKILLRKVKISLLKVNEIEFFLFKLKKKLLNANTSGYFNQYLFSSYLNFLEEKIIQDYFLYRKQFSLIIFLQYLKIRKILDPKLPLYIEIKLLIKSIMFYKNKHSIEG